jgi:hypothetical protein
MENRRDILRASLSIPAFLAANTPALADDDVSEQAFCLERRLRKKFGGEWKTTVERDFVLIARRS